MAVKKSVLSQLLGAKPSPGGKPADPGADLVDAAREVLRALFVSGSDWSDLRIAGDGMDSHGRRPKELAEALLLLLSGKASKLYFFDAKNPDKHIAIDRKTLMDPAFLAALRDGKSPVAPEAPSEYKRLMNRLNGKYQKEIDEYQLKKTLYDIKTMQQQGKELGRDQLELPEEAEIDLAAAKLEMTPEVMTQAEQVRQAEEEKERLITQGKMTEEDYLDEDVDEAGLTVAEKRRRAAFKVLNRDDAGKGEIIDAIAVLLTCHMVAGKEGVENNAELFDKAVGDVKKQPAFMEMSKEPDTVREKAMVAAETPEEELKAGAGLVAIKEQAKALRAENVVFHEFLKMARAVKALAPAPHKKPAAPVKAPQAQPTPQVKPKAPVPVRVLTMERRVDDDKKK